MPLRSYGKFVTGLSERFASTWLLLSDTTNFLSRTSILPQYEAELMDLRRRLAATTKSSATEGEVRRELTLLRKALREQGYDLSLGKLELSFQGFRNDASTRQGFRRLVLFIGNRKLWVAEGEDNHVELHRRLEKSLEGSDEQVFQKHYLWYSWNHDQLVLSGSDTETAEDFETLKTWCAQPERRLFLLSRLKTLK